MKFKHGLKWGHLKPSKRMCCWLISMTTVWALTVPLRFHSSQRTPGPVFHRIPGRK